ncbi:MAG: flagellar basal body P-ring formation protein FlgA [Desulfobacterales bacterium]|nr:MAG: flagellar basal body P-ring formation protein FlgA [Desulfobacterales bacterium]
MKSHKDIRLRLLIIVSVAGMLWQAMAVDASAAGGMRISVSSKTLLDGDSVYLGNIAQVEGDDPQLVERLNNILIGRAPLPGNTLEFEAADLSRRLKQNGFDPDELVLRTPSKVVVERSLIVMSQAKIKTLVADYITNNLLAGLPDARIKDIRIAEDIELPGGHISYTVNPTRNAESMGKIPFTINFDVNGKFFKRVWATATVEVFSDVVVTQKPLGRYKPITEDDIEVQKMDLANLPADVITDPEAVLGKRTRRAIGAQTVLRPHLVEFPPLVKRGDVVVIIAETEGLKVTALGEVKKKGRIGERIPVINFDSKKILYARVVDANTVKVDF